MDEDIKNKIRESTFYKHYMELLISIRDSYAFPEEYFIDKLNEEDLDKIVLDLFGDNYFNDMVDKNIQESLEKYAAIKENSEPERSN